MSFVQKIAIGKYDRRIIKAYCNGLLKKHQRKTIFDIDVIDRKIIKDAIDNKVGIKDAFRAEIFRDS